jgi:hypothetical protein
MWKAAQAHAPRGSGMAWRAPASDDSDEAGVYDGGASGRPGLRLTIERPRPGVIRRLARLYLPDPGGWHVPGLAPSLAIVSLVQAGMIALLLAVPPTPERLIVTRTITVPAAARGPAGAQRGSGGSASTEPTATVQESSHIEPQRPATFTENFVAGMREAPAAAGRGVAAVWRAGVDLAKSAFSRVREAVSQ